MRKGFTLIEMVLVLALLTLGFLPMVLSFASGITSSENSTDMSKAVQLATERMENIRSLSYASLANSNEAYGTISGYPNFKSITTVNELHTNLTGITVEVIWQSANRTGSVTLETYVANY